MKLSIERAVLLKSLAHVQSVVERRNTIPILANVLIAAGDDQVTLTATDMDLSVVEAAAASVGQKGAVTAPAHTLYEIVRKLPDGAEVEMTAAGGQLQVQAGRAKFSLPCLAAEEFPTLEAGDLPFQFSLPATELRRLIDRTRFAVSTEETRFYLNGIYIHVAEEEGGVLRAVATDGHRLARVEIPQPQGAEGMPGVIIPRKAVNELRKLIDDGDDEVAIALSEAKIQFSFGGVVLTSKLIDGTFPDYGRVIPEGNSKLMDIDCASFAAAVDRVATISTEKSRAVKLALSEGLLTLSAVSPEAGSAVEELEVGYKGGPLEIGFNARYLLDIAQQIDGAAAQFALADSASPTLVRNSDDPGVLFVLMPMRV